MVGRIRFKAAKHRNPKLFRNPILRSNRFVPRGRGPVEWELMEAVELFSGDNESRQDELERLLDAIRDLKPYRKLSDKARGWVYASIKYHNAGYELPEPDRSNWLSPMMQHVCGAPTMKQFVKRDLGSPRSTICIEPEDQS
jgi:hypothetical protein